MLHYDQVCNHCGKDIHPPKDHAETEGELRRYMAEQAHQPQDCVYIQRAYGATFVYGHPKTNYVCLACDGKIEEFLQGAGVS